MMAADDVLHDRRAPLARGAARLHAQDFARRYFSLIVIVFPCISQKLASHRLGRPFAFPVLTRD